MPAVFKKLNLKDQREIVVLDAPDSFAAEIAALADVVVHRRLDAVDSVGFVLTFVTSVQEVEALAPAVAEAAPGDALIWFAYPKKSSRRYASDITRDRGWRVLGDLDFEGVRQVAIDEDWSAIRFRRVEYIKTLTRDPKWALSKMGRQR